MPTADATLLLPPPFSDADSSDSYPAVPAAGARHLDHVGVEAVLGAMIEQKKRASQPSFPAYVEAGAGTGSEAPSERPGRPPTRSEVFLKVR